MMLLHEPYGYATCNCVHLLPGVSRVEEHLDDGIVCIITSLEVFKTVCLDKNALYTALVTMHTVRGAVETPIINKCGNHVNSNFMTKCSLGHTGYVG